MNVFFHIIYPFELWYHLPMLPTCSTVAFETVIISCKPSREILAIYGLQMLFQVYLDSKIHSRMIFILEEQKLLDIRYLCDCWIYFFRSAKDRIPKINIRSAMKRGHNCAPQKARPEIRCGKTLWYPKGYSAHKNSKIFFKHQNCLCHWACWVYGFCTSTTSNKLVVFS